MKTFCAILLVGIIAYVEADPHHCDPLAANTHKKSSGDDMYDHVIPLEQFNKNPPGIYFVTAASPSALPDSAKFCTAPTHGNNCQAVVYFRKITKQAVMGSNEGAKDLEFETTFVGVSGTTQHAIQYKMKMKGVDSDDYIFKVAPNTEVEAMEYAKGVPTGNKVTVPSGIKNVLESEFALYYASPNGFSLYITCDGEQMWASYDEPKLAIKDDPTVVAEFKTQVENLIKIAKDKKKTNPTIGKITTEIDAEFKNLVASAA